MKRRGTAILLVLTFVLSVALSGCSGDKKEAGSATENELSGKPVEGGSIRVGISQDLDSLDPHKAVAAGTKEVLFNVYEGLVKPDKDGNLTEAVASSYEITEDAKVYTFTLRDGVKFHNGSDVTAEDVKYSIDRCADTSNGEPLVSAYSIIESVNILDAKTVEIRLSEPNTEFLAYMTTAIIPKGYDKLETEPVGTGPFQFVSRSPQENIILKKNEDYWGEKAHLDEVEFKIVADADMVVTNLKGGSIDMYMRLTSAQAAELTEGFHIEEGTMNLVQALYLNNDAEPLNNEKVRQALCYAIDPEEIMAMIADGKGVRVGTSMYPGLKKYFDDTYTKYYAQDYEKAKELLKEAGYEDGFDLEITVCSADQPHVDTAQVIVEELKNIGVNATIKPVEWEAWLEDVYAGRNFQSTVVGVDASNLSARAMLERFVSDADGNFINFNDKEYDATFQKAIAAIDEEEQTALYKELEGILTEKAANVYIQDLANLVAISDAYDGYEFYPLYVQDMSAIYKVE
ncbi:MULTISPECIES: ABC transporter substrate-binding protein [Mediterraneibacter]|jgi:peptide/nickel transport system substrate-binding protein|uniref:ABC transporter substrate-binding protein n=1 Tax=Mediterraneibacter TaxID=2316020 RepID=UPI000E47952C|nr:ABC transporter substrate-binding protein [Mediterraneibacter massiliensis]RGT72732.1 ABC transporter substrate-binding protein [Ruminococcus sp. AF18-22]